MVIDILIAVLMVSIILRGRDTGLVRQLCSAAGFIGGLLLGAWLQPHLMTFVDTILSRALVSITATLGGAFLFMNIGEYAGGRLKSRIRGWLPLDKADAILGSLAGAVSLLAAVWLFAPVAGGLPSPAIQQALHNSSVISSLDRVLPSAPDVISRVDKLINPNGFPDVFAGLERRPLDPDTPLPSLGDLQTAVQTTRVSVVKLEGRGCGGLVDGSGFVAGSGLVITNAHVVAGVERPMVIDTNGRHNGRVVLFDPQLDIAVLRVANLAGAPLALNSSVAPNGTASVVAGYPGGGGFTVKPSTVMDQFTARGRDIYGRGITSRPIYELKAEVIPGNSGGPLISKDGQVIGVVFAQSTTYQNIGYALTMGPVIQKLQQAQDQTAAVATGSCAE